MIHLAKQTGKKYGIDVAPTCDAKYLEVGVTSKSDNVNVILEKICTENNIKPEECTYWGDEYVGRYIWKRQFYENGKESKWRFL